MKMTVQWWCPIREIKYWEWVALDDDHVYEDISWKHFWRFDSLSSHISCTLKYAKQTQNENKFFCNIVIAFIGEAFLKTENAQMGREEIEWHFGTLFNKKNI